MEFANGRFQTSLVVTDRYNPKICPFFCEAEQAPGDGCPRRMTVAYQSFDDSDPLANLDPAQLARMALGSASTRKWALANLRYVVRHCRQNAEMVELTGAVIYLLGGAKELRRIADSAETSAEDGDGQVVRLMLLSGFWRSDEAQSLLH